MISNYRKVIFQEAYLKRWRSIIKSTSIGINTVYSTGGLSINESLLFFDHELKFSHKYYENQAFNFIKSISTDFWLTDFPEVCDINTLADAVSYSTMNWKDDDFLIRLFKTFYVIDLEDEAKVGEAYTMYRKQIEVAWFHLCRTIFCIALYAKRKQRKTIFEILESQFRVNLNYVPERINILD